MASLAGLHRCAHELEDPVVNYVLTELEKTTIKTDDWENFNNRLIFYLKWKISKKIKACDALFQKYLAGDDTAKKPGENLEINIIKHHHFVGYHGNYLLDADERPVEVQKSEFFNAMKKWGGIENYAKHCVSEGVNPYSNTIEGVINTVNGMKFKSQNSLSDDPGDSIASLFEPWSRDKIPDPYYKRRHWTLRLKYCADSETIPKYNTHTTEILYCAVLACQNACTDTKLLRVLLSEGADPNFCVEEHMNLTFLILLTRKADIDGLRVFFDVARDDINVDQLDSTGNGKGGFDAVYYAFSGPRNYKIYGVEHIKKKKVVKHYLTIKVLKKYGKLDVEYLVRNGSRTPSIVYAAQDGRRGVEFVKYLLENGADPSARSTRFGGQTALHAAVENDSLITVSMLLEAGCDTFISLIPQNITNISNPKMNQLGSLAVELSLNTLDMRCADAIFRWEEEHDIKHYDNDGKSLTGASSSSQCNVLLVRKYVNKYRKDPSDISGGLVNLELKEMVTMTSHEVEMTAEEIEGMYIVGKWKAMQTGSGEVRGIPNPSDTVSVTLEDIKACPFAPACVLKKYEGYTKQLEQIHKKNHVDRTDEINKKKKKIKQKNKKAQNRECAFCAKPGVGSQLKQCIDCRKVYYCNRECQKSHWKSHKKRCKREKEKREKEKREREKENKQR